ncbi:hypothetical protein, partial [Nocardia cyriacigeorgica]|uniref:hypothetical protein n=1 Tax=Nocardia cyriacigeorgica TaxID=135487 RepID=UPI0024544C5C
MIATATLAVAGFGVAGGGGRAAAATRRRASTKTSHHHEADFTDVVGFAAADIGGRAIQAFPEFTLVQHIEQRLVVSGGGGR